MVPYEWLAEVFLVIDLSIRFGLSIRVIMRRRPVGVTMAWLLVILVFPLFGALIYLMFGELRLGNRRAEWAAKIHEPYMEWVNELHSRFNVDWSKLGVESEPLARLAEAAVQIPAVPGNHLQLIDNWQEVFDAIIADIDSAERTVHMVFYIWHMGGRADEITEALLRARKRGVTCRILVDE
ncbi:MAG: PLDc N-terminal domain-containing protein, partial [Planctomycetales bacterium]